MRVGEEEADLVVFSKSEGVCGGKRERRERVFTVVD